MQTRERQSDLLHEKSQWGTEIDAGQIIEQVRQIIESGVSSDGADGLTFRTLIRRGCEKRRRSRARAHAENPLRLSRMNVLNPLHGSENIELFAHSVRGDLSAALSVGSEVEREDIEPAGDELSRQDKLTGLTRRQAV